MQNKQLWWGWANHGHELCQLLSLPSCTVQQVTLGILLVMRLESYNLCAGQWLWEALDNTGLAHANNDGRCDLLWQNLQAYYKVTHIQFQLQNLTLSMLKPGANPPTIRGKCTQVLCIVGLGCNLQAKCTRSSHPLPLTRYTC